MGKLHVSLRKIVDDSYDIEIGTNLFNVLVKDLKSGLLPYINKFAVLTDSIVEELYGRHLINLLTKEGIDVDLFSFPAGEKHKNRETKGKIEDMMLKKSFGRDSCIIALGGGTVTDIGGFIAGTYCRGIPYINYATTLLAAADASIGGKTAVNTLVATNQIGLFHQPKKVYVDIKTWSTLSRRQINSGLAETIIHACIADYEFFSYLEEKIDDLISTDSLTIKEEIMLSIAYKNCEIKYKIVEKDEHERNLRQILNLGHTAGRAIETLCKYELLHGEAVSIGLVFQAYLGLKFGYISMDDYSRIKSLLKKIGLPTEIPPSVNAESLLLKMYTDKKVKKGEIHFVFQDGIGKMKKFNKDKYSIAVKEEILLDTIKGLHLNQN